MSLTEYFERRKLTNYLRDLERARYIVRVAMQSTSDLDLIDARGMDLVTALQTFVTEETDFLFFAEGMAQIFEKKCEVDLLGQEIPTYFRNIRCLKIPELEEGSILIHYKNSDPIIIKNIGDK